MTPTPPAPRPASRHSLAPVEPCPATFEVILSPPSDRVRVAGTARLTRRPPRAPGVLRWARAVTSRPPCPRSRRGRPSASALTDREACRGQGEPEDRRGRAGLQPGQLVAGHEERSVPRRALSTQSFGARHTGGWGESLPGPPMASAHLLNLDLLLPGAPGRGAWSGLCPAHPLRSLLPVGEGQGPRPRNSLASSHEKAFRLLKGCHKKTRRDCPPGQTQGPRPVCARAPRP